jgi:hypothetical protein
MILSALFYLDAAQLGRGKAFSPAKLLFFRDMRKSFRENQNSIVAPHHQHGNRMI